MYALYQQLKALVFDRAGTVSDSGTSIKTAKEERCPQEPQKRYFSGEITSLSETSGMIDQQVYFDVSCVIGCRLPQVGAMVHVIAERPHPLAGWRATRVEVTEMWNSDEIEERKTLIGFISKLSRSLAVVDCATREVTFDPRACVHIKYLLQTGDWVIVEMKSVNGGTGDGGTEEGEGEVEYVQPLREREVEGQVTFLSQGQGFIDDDIIFTLAVCGRGQSVNVGDHMRGKCVECRHHKASWRAVSLTHVSATPHSHTPSPLSPSLPLTNLSPTPMQSLTSKRDVSGLMENKAGLVIGEQCDVGKVLIGKDRSITVSIRNTRSCDHLLLSVKPLPQDPQLHVTFPPHKQWCTCMCYQQQLLKQDRQRVLQAVRLPFLVSPHLLPTGSEVCSGEEGGTGHTLDQELDRPDDVEPECGIDSTECALGMKCGKVSRMELGSVDSPHLHIASGESLEVTVTVKASTLGQICCLLLFTFAGAVRIARTLRANVGSPDVDSLGPSSVYRGGRGSGGRGRGSRDGPRNMVPGEKLPRRRLLRLPHRLKPYPIPDDLWECVCEGDKREVLSIRPQLTEPLCMKNYNSRFSSLLHLEEIQREIDMRTFDLNCVPLRVCGQYLSLEVPGLAEGRPSLLMGDRVVVCVTGGGERDWEGYIHETRRDRVLLKFAQEFHQHFDNQDYDVVFQFSRTTFRRMHHAVEIAHLLGPTVLFPGQQTPKQPLVKISSQWSCNHGNGAVSTPSQFFNPILNPRQQVAVLRILAAQNRPAPYVIFGPPGTGKTMTLVEAILQIHHRSRESRVLACAPSNSAADLLTERLHCSGMLSPGDMVRLNAIQRAEPPSSISQYCMDTDSVDLAVRCRVVVCTCMTAGIMHSLGLAVGHFSHVVVDETGQATETEALLPATLLAGSPHGQLVLAGDPHQLGPVLASHQADSLSLSLSLLERIMAREPYLRDQAKYSDHGSYDPLMVTKLVNNYRSHSFLLRLYSDTFYHGELAACADTKMTSLLCEWEGLPRKGFPLVLHGVMGEDMREGNSPSWFNPVEIVQVVSYIQSLIDNSTYAPRLSDIGIITPYRKQVEKIRGFLSRVGVEGIKVGSVEEFQGQERLVIIISTVRSTVDMVTTDLHHHIGFLSNPKRFNVAISRAQALLVVIGNPQLLCQDPHWCVLVQYAVDNGCYTGCPLPQFITDTSNDLTTEDSGSETRLSPPQQQCT